MAGGSCDLRQHVPHDGLPAGSNVDELVVVVAARRSTVIGSVFAGRDEAVVDGARPDAFRTNQQTLGYQGRLQRTADEPFHGMGECDRLKLDNGYCCKDARNSKTWASGKDACCHDTSYKTPGLHLITLRRMQAVAAVWPETGLRHVNSLRIMCLSLPQHCAAYLALPRMRSGQAML